MSKVLVTGGSGFLGAWCVSRLLKDGHDVRASVRDLGREAEVRAMVREAGADAGPRLAVVAADLTRDEGWARAVDGCEHVLHVASPFGGPGPQTEEALVAPARDGTLRVLRAARDAGVRRVVVTSSFAAVGYGRPARREPFTEADWTDVEGPDVQPYIKSKTLAERAAWDFIGREGGGLELSVVNPVGIFGPVLGPDFSSSIEIVRGMLAGRVPATPRVYFGVVDVRDVADLHLRAMTHPAAAGERFLAVAGAPMSMLEVAGTLRRELGAAAAKAPSRQLPDLLVRVLALGSERMRQVAPQLGKRRAASHAKALQTLGWTPRANAEVIKATGRSLLDRGLIG